MNIFGHSDPSGKMTGVKTGAEETMVIETGGKETSAREANVVNEWTVAIVKIVREEIGKGKYSPLPIQIQIQILMFLQLCVSFVLKQG